MCCIYLLAERLKFSLSYSVFNFSYNFNFSEIQPNRIQEL